MIREYIFPEILYQPALYPTSIEEFKVAVSKLSSSIRTLGSDLYTVEQCFAQLAESIQGTYSNGIYSPDEPYVLSDEEIDQLLLSKQY